MTKLPQAYLNNCEEGFEVSGMIIRPKSEGTPCSLPCMNAWGDSSQQFVVRKASSGKMTTEFSNR